MQDNNCKAFKLAFLFVVLLLCGSLYVSLGYFNRLFESHNENSYLQHNVDSLKIRADSLEKASNQVKPTNAVIIKEKIITKYVKQYQDIVNASAIESYSYLVEWIPISDSLPKMVVSAGGDTCVIVRSSQVNEINTVHFTSGIYAEIIDTLLYNDSLRAEKERLLQAVISTRNEVIQKQDEQIKQSTQENSAMKKDIARRKKHEKLAIGAGAGLLILSLFIN